MGKTDVSSATTNAAEAAAAAPDRRREPLDGDLIRRRWRSLIGRHPPKTISHALMERILVWREQVVETSDVNSRSRAILAEALTGGKVDTKRSGGVYGRETENAAEDGSTRPRAALRVGTVLVREHSGVPHRVTVASGGYEWEGKVYASLSAVARAITGVRWNGHRFFALDRAAKKAGDPRPKKPASGASATSMEPGKALGPGGSP